MITCYTEEYRRFQNNEVIKYIISWANTYLWDGIAAINQTRSQKDKVLGIRNTIALIKD